MDTCPPHHSRALTEPEKALVASVFGAALDCQPVRIHRHSWWPFQPRHICMAPRGSLHFHAKGIGYLPCFASAPLPAQGFFIHEMAHVWQHQSGINLLLRRFPFSRYRYRLRAGKPLAAYGVEQQAEIIRHAFLLRHGATPEGAARHEDLEALLPFTPLAPAHGAA